MYLIGCCLGKLRNKTQASESKSLFLLETTITVENNESHELYELRHAIREMTDSFKNTSIHIHQENPKVKDCLQLYKEEGGVFKDTGIKIEIIP